MTVCSICQSPNTNKTTCPCNPEVEHPDYLKHLYWYETCPKAKIINIPRFKKVIKINDKNKMLILCGGWTNAVNEPARKTLENYYKVNFGKNNTLTANLSIDADLTYDLFSRNSPLPSDVSFIFIEYCPLDLYLEMSMTKGFVEFTPSIKRIFNILPLGGQVIMPLITRLDFEDDPQALMDPNSPENKLILMESQKMDLMGSMGFNIKDIIPFPNKYGISHLIIYEKVI